MIVKIGIGSCGIAAGALPVWDAAQEEIAANGISAKIEQTGCIGMCHHEPLLELIYEDGRSYMFGHVTPEIAREIMQAEQPETLEKYLVATKEKPNDFLAKQLRVALRNCGIIDPESIDDYIQLGGYKALEKVIKGNDPEAVIEEIKNSGLRGRGGAGFPTWFKWNATRQEKNPDKYVVCNADEGDPGAFMDRSVLEGDPHSLLEGMAIAGYAIGARQGIIYARAEYPLAVKRVEIAIQAARDKQILGNNILGQVIFPLILS